MNWINQTVIDGIVDGVGKGAVKAAEATTTCSTRGWSTAWSTVPALSPGHRRGLNPSSPARSVSTGAAVAAQPPSRALILVIVV